MNEQRNASMIHLRRGLASLLAMLGMLVVVAAPTAIAQTAPQPPDAEAREAPARRAVIRFVTETDYPPFNYLDEEGGLTGFNVDLARALCLDLNTTCDVQARPWSELLAILLRGEADAVIASHTISPQLLRRTDVTDRYYYTPARFAGKRGGSDVAITPEGLEGKSIAVVKGSAHEAYLRAFFRDSTIRTFDTVDDARTAVPAGAADYVFDDGTGLVFWLNGTASKACCEFKGGPFVEPKYFGDGIGIVVKKEDSELKSSLNTALKHVRESGRYEELVLRYFPFRAY